MDDKIIVALIGLAGGAIGSLFAPWANWGIEKRKQKLAYRRELITNWRSMMVRVTRKQRQSIFTVNDAERGEFLNLEGHRFYRSLENEPDYHSLRSHLSLETAIEINKVSDDVWTDDVADVIQTMMDEIARLEKKWGLV